MGAILSATESAATSPASTAPPAEHTSTPPVAAAPLPSASADEAGSWLEVLLSPFKSATLIAVAPLKEGEASVAVRSSQMVGAEIAASVSSAPCVAQPEPKLPGPAAATTGPADKNAAPATPLPGVQREESKSTENGDNELENQPALEECKLTAPLTVVKTTEDDDDDDDEVPDLVENFEQVAVSLNRSSSTTSTATAVAEVTPAAVASIAETNPPAGSAASITSVAQKDTEKAAAGRQWRSDVPHLAVDPSLPLSHSCFLRAEIVLHHWAIPPQNLEIRSELGTVADCKFQMLLRRDSCTQRLSAWVFLRDKPKEHPFPVRTMGQFQILAPSSGRWCPTHAAVEDVFSAFRQGPGYYDLLGMSWEDLLASDFVSAQGTVEVGLQIVLPVNSAGATS